ncbi:MAG: hypothetical protein JWP61_1793 [Friedmanniella sp.]|nr:hypothetical protein [Friedmanniella sp.]
MTHNDPTIARPSHRPSATEWGSEPLAVLACTGDVSGPVTQPDGPALDLARQNARDTRGMVSAEWAVGIIAAIAVAGVLLAVVTDGSVREAILKFILAAINQFSGGFGKLW